MVSLASFASSRESTLFLARRERAVIGHLLVEPDDFGIARQLPDRGFHFVAGERSWIISHELFKFFVELEVFEGLGHRPAQSLDDFYGRSRRQDVRPARVEKRSK